LGREVHFAVVAKLSQLARSLRDAKDVTLSIGGSVHDPSIPVRRLLVNVLAMVAEFESNLIRTRTRQGTPVAKAFSPVQPRNSARGYKLRTWKTMNPQLLLARR